MGIELINCPHCGVRIAPMNDGACPSCREDTNQPPPQQVEAGETSAWERFQRRVEPVPSETEPVEPSPVDEEPFLGIRLQVVSQFTLSGNVQVDDTHADRIEQEVIPQFVTVLEQLNAEDGTVHTDAKWSNYLALRLECWRTLVESIRLNDRSLFNQHIEMWEQCDLVRINVDGASVKRPLTPAEVVTEFGTALRTFTPALVLTPGIVAVNLIVFVVMMLAGVNFIQIEALAFVPWGANYGPKTMNGEWWRMLTCIFVHFGLLHISINMWCLWVAGRLVERLVGNVGFFILYVTSGLAGSLASLAWNPHFVAAGASGAVFGVLGALFGVLALRKDTVPRPVLRQLRNSLGTFVAINLVMGFITPQVDNAAHVGGLVVGFACGLALSQPLSMGALPKRKLRNSLVFVASAVALPLGVMALPDAPPDVQAEMNHFAKVEQEVLNLNNTTVEAARRNAISLDEFERIVESEILPKWVALRKRVESLQRVKSLDRKWLAKLIRYMKARESSWVLRLAGVREQDQGKIKQADTQWSIAEEFVKEVTGRKGWRVNF